MSIYGPKIKSNMLPEDDLINTLNSLIDTLNSLINALSESSANNNLDTRKSKSSEPKQIALNEQPANSGGFQQNTAISYIKNM